MSLRSKARCAEAQILSRLLAIVLATTTALSEEVAKPNRTLPKFTPPKTTLEFSANPTVEEISRANVLRAAGTDWRRTRARMRMPHWRMRYSVTPNAANQTSFRA